MPEPDVTPAELEEVKAILGVATPYQDARIGGLVAEARAFLAAAGVPAGAATPALLARAVEDLSAAALGAEARLSPYVLMRAAQEALRGAGDGL